MSAPQVEEISTCVESLVHAGVCCEDACTEPATVATLDNRLTEHTRCGVHVADAIAVKPLRISPLWAPADPGT